MVQTLLLKALEERNPACTHNSTYALQQQHDFDSFDFRIFEDLALVPSHAEPCLPFTHHSASVTLYFHYSYSLQVITPVRVASD